MSHRPADSKDVFPSRPVQQSAATLLINTLCILGKQVVHQRRKRSRDTSGCDDKEQPPRKRTRATVSIEECLMKLCTFVLPAVHNTTKPHGFPGALLSAVSLFISNQTLLPRSISNAEVSMPSLNRQQTSVLRSLASFLQQCEHQTSQTAIEYQPDSKTSLKAEIDRLKTANDEHRQANRLLQEELASSRGSIASLESALVDAKALHYSANQTIEYHEHKNVILIGDLKDAIRLLQETRALRDTEHPPPYNAANHIENPPAYRDCQHRDDGPYTQDHGHVCHDAWHMFQTAMAIATTDKVPLLAVSQELERRAIRLAHYRYEKPEHNVSTILSFLETMVCLPIWKAPVQWNSQDSLRIKLLSVWQTIDDNVHSVCEATVQAIEKHEWWTRTRCRLCLDHCARVTARTELVWRRARIAQMDYMSMRVQNLQRMVSKLCPSELRHAYKPFVSDTWTWLQESMESEKVHLGRLQDVACPA